MAKSNTLKTPWGRAVYPRLQTEDPTYGGYSVRIVPENEGELEAFQEQLQDAIAGTRFKTKTPQLPFPETQDGTVSIRAKSKFKPLGVDSKNNLLPEDVVVGAGSLIRLLVEPNVYDKGVSLYLKQYQVKELKEADTRSAFEAEDDGFTVSTRGDFGSEDADHSLDI
jgi:hypothetical protein